MPFWKKTMTIRHLITDDTDFAAIVGLAQGVLDNQIYTGPRRNFIKAMELAETDPETALILVNQGMNQLYDWADMNYVWIN